MILGKKSLWSNAFSSPLALASPFGRRGDAAPSLLPPKGTRTAGYAGAD
ncbi:MAG: hypothetical protein ACYTXA_21765 [Nostoc sp.]